MLVGEAVRFPWDVDSVPTVIAPGGYASILTIMRDALCMMRSHAAA